MDGCGCGCGYGCACRCVCVSVCVCVCIVFVRVLSEMVSETFQRHVQKLSNASLWIVHRITQSVVATVGKS